MENKKSKYMIADDILNGKHWQKWQFSLLGV